MNYTLRYCIDDIHLRPAQAPGHFLLNTRDIGWIEDWTPEELQVTFNGREVHVFTKIHTKRDGDGWPKEWWYRTPNGRFAITLFPL